MPITIEIPESQLSHLKTVYEGIAKDVIDRAIGCKNEWIEIEPILSQLGIALKFPNYYSSSKAQINKNLDQSKKEPTWLDRAISVLEKANKPLKALEIYDLIVLDETIDKRVARNSVPGTLSVAGAAGKLKRTKNESDEWLYELAEKKEANSFISSGQITAMSKVG